MSDKVILCVDDEQMVLTSLEHQLENHFGDRYQYEFAESADEAWEVIEELDEDGIDVLIIVSDWLMPGMRGDEFLIRVHKKCPRIVKVMLTGQADGAAIERAKQEANLFRCLHKPWEKQALIETIETGLGI